MNQKFKILKSTQEFSEALGTNLIATTTAGGAFTSSEEPFDWFISAKPLAGIDGDRYSENDYGVIELMPNSKFFVSVNMNDSEFLHFQIEVQSEVPENGLAFRWKMDTVNGTSFFDTNTERHVIATQAASVGPTFQKVEISAYNSIENGPIQDPIKILSCQISKYTIST